METTLIVIILFFITNFFIIIDGHYIAYCRNDLDKNWYEFDDTLVTRVNAMEVMSKEAYVLFYQKKTSNHMDQIKMQCKSMLQNSESRQVTFFLCTFRSGK